MSIESVMPSNDLILCYPLLLPLIFPSIRVFSSELAPFASGGQGIVASASASVLPMNIQGWFLLGLTGLIAVKVKVAQSCPTLCDPMDYTVHGILQTRILEWVTFPFSKGSSQPTSPALQADSLPAEPPEKSKNTGVGSLSLLQWIFLTQESNWGLLHCRWILYQLNYQGSPWLLWVLCNSRLPLTSVAI